MGERHAVTNKMAAAYRRGSRPEKSAILDQLCELTGWHRDYARARLRRAGEIRVVRDRRPRAPLYSSRVVSGLEACWRVARAPAGKRLAPMLGVLVPMLVRDGELDLSVDEAELLASMSAATIDRRLQGVKAAAGLRGKSHTKPGSQLLSQIPIRTWSEWDEGVPGFVEIDLVGHEGGDSFGEFCFTLTMTDVATGWTVNRSVPNKAAINVTLAIEHARRAFPFPILGIDSDNGSEFINAHLFDYCVGHKITFTRSRPGNKNDGAHVEQKNWTHCSGHRRLALDTRRLRRGDHGFTLRPSPLRRRRRTPVGGVRGAVPGVERIRAPSTAGHDRRGSAFASARRRGCALGSRLRRVHPPLDSLHHVGNRRMQRAIDNHAPIPRRGPDRVSA